ncbi:MAG: hypothetical protein ETSY2_39560 [Candidatus Entotheonella gemina]|uniref:Uncharacterized protein n=1 Tax=Candidatus Entotheonella gemina TaxID=1429439 RepID=W4LQE2_9BACT|nr:MAG: hypothetical protein ETSY2_39560 [Candidatus Entotheonella gemina]
MSADTSENPSSAPEPEPQNTSDSLQEPHLLNIDSVMEVAQWLALAAASGIVGNVAYDLLNSIRRRLGPETTKVVGSLATFRDHQEFKNQSYTQWVIPPLAFYPDVAEFFQS